MKTTVKTIFTAIGLTLLLSSCADLQSRQGQGTAIGAGAGAGIGAVLGQAVGRDKESTMIGAGIGAVLGGVAGNQIGAYMDRQEQELRAVVAQSESASVRRSQDVLVATFKSETFFESDSSTLLYGGYQEMARVAQVLKKYAETRIEVGGHTDSRGSEEYNRQLSLRRAEAVKASLVHLGVDPSRIVTVGYGESRPVSSSHAMNRRVEIVIIPVNG